MIAESARQFDRRGVGSEVYKPLVTGELVRDWKVNPGAAVLFPYDTGLLEPNAVNGLLPWMWPYRTVMGNRGDILQENVLRGRAAVVGVAPGGARSFK